MPVRPGASPLRHALAGAPDHWFEGSVGERNRRVRAAARMYAAGFRPDTIVRRMGVDCLGLTVRVHVNAFARACGRPLSARRNTGRGRAVSRRRRHVERATSSADPGDPDAPGEAGRYRAGAAR